MSFYEDFVSDGSACFICGEYIDGKSPGHPRQCKECGGDEKPDKPKKSKTKRNRK